MPEFRCRSEFQARPEAIPRIAQFIEAACEDAGVIPEARFDLELAVEEACANIIEHAYAGSDGSFSVEFATRGADVLITLQDRGQAFDPGTIEPPDIHANGEDRRAGGLGLHLMKTLMDEVEFSFTEHGNFLRMMKRDIVAKNSDA